MPAGMYCVNGTWYPEYPELGAGVVKFRKLANKAGSIAAMAKAERHAYADAIEKAIRAKHRAMHMRPTPSPTAGWYSVPSVTRLLRYENPLPMHGDPDWKDEVNCKCRYHEKCHCDFWGARERLVYAAAMQAKR